MIRYASLSYFLLFSFVIKSVLGDTILFENSDQEPQKTDENGGISVRLGLLSSQLGLSPTGALLNGNNQKPKTNSFEHQVALSRPRTVVNPFSDRFCCCVSSNKQCPRPSVFGGGTPDGQNPDLDLVGLGVIDVRSRDSVSTRIVNDPDEGNSEDLRCGFRQHRCCYSSIKERNNIIHHCDRPNPLTEETAIQKCRGRIRAVPGSKMCGTRDFRTIHGLPNSQASPGEFPWTCLILKENNDFVGSCALIPNREINDLRAGTNLVITAAHVFKKVHRHEVLKVRLGEWDASKSRNEEIPHLDLRVIRRRIHPRFNAKRLSNDIAVLTLSRTINVNQFPNINAACLPSCKDMFDFQFRNGTGARCWVAGWGKKSIDSPFEPIMRKTDVPLVTNQHGQCDSLLRSAIHKRLPRASSKFFLDDSEICAGGVGGKDACKGDGGAPLICQSNTGHWTVVGLVAWGVGCGQPNVPGVYVNVHHFVDWILS